VSLPDLVSLARPAIDLPPALRWPMAVGRATGRVRRMAETKGGK
jgi:hypothetical protein